MEILRGIVAPTEEATACRFLSIIRQFHGHEKRRKLFNVTRAMLSFLPLESRAFVLRTFKEGILGRDWLNIVVQLRCILFDPIIIASHLFMNGDREALGKAVNNFPVGAVLNILRFLAVNSDQPAKIVERMLAAECFREGFVPEWSADKWK